MKTAQRRPPDTCAGESERTRRMRSLPPGAASAEGRTHSPFFLSNGGLQGVDSVVHYKKYQCRAGRAEVTGHV